MERVGESAFLMPSSCNETGVENELRVGRRRKCCATGQNASERAAECHRCNHCACQRRGDGEPPSQNKHPGKQAARPNTAAEMD